MRKYGLIGYPLGHSFSQKFFTEKFAAEKIIDCSYENFPIATIGDFPELLNENVTLCGLNVTIPYKTEILKYIDIKSPEVTDIGAANVLKFKRAEGKLLTFGYNSDITGIEDSLKPYITGKVKSALILGTGGSSRSVTYVLKKYGIKVTHVSREKRSGIICYRDISGTILKLTQLIVNATPLGMYPDILSKPDLDYSLLNKNHILFDLVYNPELTSFLKMGNERGCTIISGLKMLYSQAVRSWEIWNNDKY